MKLIVKVVIITLFVRQYSINCPISRTDVVILKHLNYLMEQCKEPGVNQQIAYEGVKLSIQLQLRIGLATSGALCCSS